MNIELKVDHHPCGNLTLKKRISGGDWTDLKPDTGLFATNDHLLFYRTLAKYMAKESANNMAIVSYEDTELI